MRRIGVLMNTAAGAPQSQARPVAFKQALEQSGWSEGGNVRIDTRWGANDIERDRRYAVELTELTPDVILAAGTVAVAALQYVTRALPIVFVIVLIRWARTLWIPWPDRGTIPLGLCSSSTV